MSPWTLLPCLLIAGLLGALIGWLLKSWLTGNRERDLENSWSQKLSSKTSGLETLQSNFNKNKSKLSGIETDLTSRSAELTARTKELATVQASLGEWEGKYKALETSHQTANTKNEEALAALRAQLAQAQGEITTSAAAAASWEKKFKDVGATQVAGDAKDKKEIADLRAQLLKARVDLDTRTRAAEKLEADLAAHKQDSSGYETKIAGLVASVVAFEAFKSQAGASEGQLKADLASAQSGLSDCESKHKTLESDMAARETELSALRARIVELESNATQAQADLQAANASLAAAASATTADAKADQEAEEKYKTALVARESELLGLRGRITELEKLSGKAQTDLQTATLALASAHAANAGAGKDVEAKYQTLLAASAVKDAEISKLNARVAELDLIRKEATGDTDLILIEGIGKSFYSKLAGIGIKWQKDLLAQGATKKGRQEIAEKSGIVEANILTWVNHCDLCRIDGVSEQFAELLEIAGIDSVPDLSQRNAENLFKKVVEVNNEYHVSPATPTEEDINAWVERAKQLERVVTH